MFWISTIWEESTQKEMKSKLKKKQFVIYCTIYIHF